MASVISLFALSILVMTSSTVALGPPAVALRTAGNFTILAQSGISTVPSSVINGDIGVSPGAGTLFTGFSPTLDPSGTFSTSTQVIGKLLAASYTSPTPSTLTTAISDMQTAYTDASSRPNPNFLNLGGGLIGGLVLIPGLYKWTTGVLATTDVTIAGTAIDTWIFQTTGTLKLSAGVHIILLGGALAKNIVWVVADVVTVGTSAHFEGVLLAKTAATLQTTSTMNGRILSQTFVALQEASITPPP